MNVVSFTRMIDGTREDYAFLEEQETVFKQGTAGRVLSHLEGLAGSTGGYRIDRLQHSLQTATRAFRDGADEETVVVALLHDIGDLLAPDNHSEFAAAILRPYVSEANHWLVLKHGIFQGYFFWHHYDRDRDAREKYRGHPHFEHTADFCEKWDQTSFDPAYDTMPLSAFVPMVERLFERPAYAESAPENA